MSKPFTTNITEGIAELILDHPPVNAFDRNSWFAIAEEIERLGLEQEPHVIIIAAKGKGFCAGVDIKELAAHPERIVDVNKGNYATFKAIHLNPKPVIVALHGYVLGGGIGISGAADIVVASDCTRFGVPEVDRGAMGGGAHLQRLFPIQKVRLMYFTGEMTDAQEAYRLGAVEAVVPREKLLDSARDIAARIAAKSPDMIKLAKEALNSTEHSDLEKQYRREQGFTLEAYTLADSQEARDAFIEKRNPEFNAE